MAARYGSGRHRQTWYEVVCDRCGSVAQARRTVPGKPLYVRAHFTADDRLCTAQTKEIPQREIARAARSSIPRGA